MDWNKRRQRLATVLRKAVAFHSHPTEETFPELPDVLVWFRFSLAVAYGLYLGLSGVRSSVYVLQALNLITFVPVLYCRLYLGISDFAGASSTLSSTFASSSSSSSSFGSQIVFAGTINALALTLLLWIYFFTAQHEDDERKLASLLVAISKDDTTIKPENFVETTIVNGGMTAAGGEAAGMTPKGVTDDPEF